MRFYSPEREAEVLKRVKKINNRRIPEDVLEFLFTQIMSVTFSLNAPLKIAYLGPSGTFTHMAAIKKFGEQIDFISFNDISDIFGAVENEEVNFGVVPIENSTEGIITHTLDMFIDSNLSICSEVIMKISHHLLGCSRIKDIKSVYSHPQVFPQCRRWLQENMPWVELIPASTTSKAAEIVKNKKDSACIASLASAKFYKLKVLAENIQDSSDNVTRFLVIGKYLTSSTGKDKTSVLFSVKDRVGALSDMLKPFKNNNINLTKIESRPSRKKPWEYYFFVDFNGHATSRKTKKALAELETKCKFLKVLGSYPTVV
jgi:chorismate mutase / prephenate dehydratase